jgi:FtsH-binding integral membrane protein
MEQYEGEDQKDQGKVKRYVIWAVFLVIVGMIAMFFGPPETVSYFFQLLGDIITNLAI